VDRVPRWLERFINFWIHPPVHWTGQTCQFATLERNIESGRAVATAEPTG